MTIDLHGVVPAMITPFTEGGAAVDYEKAAAVATHLADRGVHGLFVGGTTGEGLLMSPDEREKLLEVVIDAAGGRTRVIAHAGALDTATTIRLLRHARDAGAHAAATVAPGFFPYDGQALKQYFISLAESVRGYPILLYNIPSRSLNAITPELALELAERCENIVGIKESGGVIQDLNEILTGRKPDFIVFNGVDEYTMQAVLTGVEGSVGSTANVAPQLFLDIYHHARLGDTDAAWRSQKALNTACALLKHGAMPACYKEALRCQGVDAGYCRPPQRELTDEEKRALAQGMEALGLR